MRYRTTILATGKTAAGLEVPTEVLDALGTSRKPAVKVTINGFTYRSTVATVDGRFMVGVSNDVRKVAVPADFAAALDAEPAARSFFDGLSYSNKRRFVMPIDDAKTAETRQRRIEASVVKLRVGRL